MAVENPIMRQGEDQIWRRDLSKHIVCYLGIHRMVEWKGPTMTRLPPDFFEHFDGWPTKECVYCGRQR